MTEQLQPEIYADLIGKRFAAGKRGPDTFDCLGLAIFVSRRRGLLVPDFGSTREELEQQLTAGALGPCREVPRAVPGAIVLCRSVGGVGRHLGVMVDGARVLHTSELAGSVVLEVLGRSLWARRVLGFYLQVRP